MTPLIFSLSKSWCYYITARSIKSSGDIETYSTL